MKKISNSILVFFILCVFGAVFFGQPMELQATQFVVGSGGTTPSDGPAGSYTTVTPTDARSAPGQVELEVLGGEGATSELHVQGDNTASATEGGDRDTPMGDIWDFFDGIGATSVGTLFLAFGENEAGGSSDFVIITYLDITFEVPAALVPTFGSSLEYSLGDDEVKVFNFGSGNALGEALFQIDLPDGFDFMSVYNTDSMEQFNIDATITWVSDSSEKFFFHSAFPPEPPPSVPEPGTMLLVGTGLVCLAGFRRKFRT